MSQLVRTSPARALALALLLPLAACASLTEPGNGAPPPAPDEPTADAAVAAAAQPAPPTPAAPPPPAPAAEEQIATSHLLVQWKGSQRAPATITRTKEEARKRADEALAKIKKGQDFATVVGDYSDEPGAKQRGGVLPKFGRSSAFDPRFKEGAFKLKAGEVSGLVESDFGYHVIKRTE